MAEDLRTIITGLRVSSNLERIGDYANALADLEQYVQFRVGARDLQTVNEAVRSLRRQIGPA